VLVIPAVDIREEKCVRLVQGRIDRETVYSEDPVQMARMWEEEGAPMLHLVDLDGAFTGIPKNLPVVEKMREQVKVPLQLGGGVRSMEIIEKILSMDIDRVVLGTAAVSDSELVSRACSKFGERIVAAVDNKGGRVAVEGWESVADKDILEFVRDLRELGVKRVVYTDTRRDGTLSGPDIEGIKRFLEAAQLKVIVSGGIASVDDLRNLAGLNFSNLEGVIIGKSLYDGSIILREALEMVGSNNAG